MPILVFRLECIPNLPGPWVYDPIGYYGQNNLTFDSREAAIDAALADIPAYWGSAFCSYNYQVNDPPWVTQATNGGRPSLQRQTNAITGWLTLVQGGGCNYTQGQAVDISRSRSFPCPAGWSFQFDSAGNAQCVRQEISPSAAKCDGGCMPGGHSQNEVDAAEFGFVGNTLHAHTGESIRVETDWSSGG